jgi:RecA/RadA recombinase
MPVDISNLDRDIEIIRKRRGKTSIQTGSEQPPISKIPLDSPALMRITSGGIPLGRITRVWGPPGGGKSRIAYLIAKAAQELRAPDYPAGLMVCWHDIEKIFSVEYAKFVGINTDVLLIREGDIIEDVARELQLLLGSCHVHVLDSASEAKPQDRLNKDPGDWDVNLKIRVWEKCYEYIMNAINKENSIIQIDHASTNFITKSEKPLGGKEMEHQSGLNLQVKQTKWLYYDEDGMLQTEEKLKDKGIIGIAGTKEADGQEMVVNVSRSRVCRPFRKAHLRLDLNTHQFDHTYELMEAAEYYDKFGNLAHRSGQPAIAEPKVRGPKNPGGWVTLPGGEKIQGQKALRQIIEADKNLQDLIRRAMLMGN